MHGGLICITLCLVWTKININDLWLKVTGVKVKGHKGQGQIRFPNEGRWAHINLKMLHYDLP